MNKSTITAILLMILVPIIITTGVAFFGIDMTASFFLAMVIFMVLYSMPGWFTISLILLSSFLSLGFSLIFLPLTLQKLTTGFAVVKYFGNSIQKKKFHFSKIDGVMLLFSCWLGLSSFMTDNINLNPTGIVRFYSFVILYFLISRFIDNSSDAMKVLKLMALGGILLLVFDFWEYNARSNFTADTFGRNTLAGQLAVLTIVSIYLAIINTRKVYKYSFWGLTLIYTVAVLINSSRGALIALMISGSIFLLIQRFSNWRILLVIFIIGTAYLLSNLLPQAYYTHSLSRLLDSQITNDTRTLIWQANIYYINHNPLWGIGFGKFPEFVNLFANNFGYHKLIDAASSHNMYLSILTETGIPGFVFFISMLILTINNIFRLRSGAKKDNDQKLFTLANCLFSMIVIYLVQGLVADAHLWEFFWILVGIIQGVVLIYETNRSSQKIVDRIINKTQSEPLIGIN